MLDAIKTRVKEIQESKTERDRILTIPKDAPTKIDTES